MLTPLSRTLRTLHIKILSTNEWYTEKHLCLCYTAMFYGVAFCKIKKNSFAMELPDWHVLKYGMSLRHYLGYKAKPQSYDINNNNNMKRQLHQLPGLNLNNYLYYELQYEWNTMAYRTPRPDPPTPKLI